MLLFNSRSLRFDGSKVSLVVGVDGQQLLVDGLDGAIHLDHLATRHSLDFPLNGLKGAALEGILIKRGSLLLVRIVFILVMRIENCFTMAVPRRRAVAKKTLVNIVFVDLLQRWKYCFVLRWMMSLFDV